MPKCAKHICAIAYLRPAVECSVKLSGTDDLADERPAVEVKGDDNVLRPQFQFRGLEARRTTLPHKRRGCRNGHNRLQGDAQPSRTGAEEESPRQQYHSGHRGGSTGQPTSAAKTADGEDDEGQQKQDAKHVKRKVYRPVGWEELRRTQKIGPGAKL